MTIFAKGIPAKNVVVDFGEQIVCFTILSCWDNFIQKFDYKVLTFCLVVLQLSVSIDLPGGETYSFQPRLFGKVRLSLNFGCFFLDGALVKISEIVSCVIENAYSVISCWSSHDWQITPAKCRYEVMSTKIEIRLAKAEPLHWTSLDYTREPVVIHRPVVSSGKPACSPNFLFWLSGGSSPPSHNVNFSCFFMFT